MPTPLSGSWTAWALALLPCTQKGDVAGEPQPPLAPGLATASAPALSPAESLASFVVADGLRVELVAAEPLIEAPVQAVFDGDGSLWVVEMRGYMRDVDGQEESAPLGRISVLHDDDGDGRMDRAVRFLDGLVLPRSVAPTRDGALVIAPPHVLFCRDTDGDGVADERTIVDSGIAGIASPEYGPNGLLPTLDNAFACARHDVRYRFAGGKWTKEAVASGGQWGIAEDDAGRLYFDTNSNVLRGHLVPPREAALNPFLDASRIADVELAKDHSVRPIRATTAVNRAYRPGWLVDGRITKADAVCGVLVERGGLFPEEFRGDVFVCEPVGNLVHWLDLGATDAVPRAAPQPDARPLLASTDERFRPVNLASGPDGAVYVVDMQRGLLQHRQFLTTFLREQTLARGLVEPLDRGRIWRVVPVDAKRERVPPLSTLSSDELLPYLGHANAFLRREAQRHFIEDDWDEAIVLPKLRAVVASAPNPLARIHALWALDGRGALDEDTLIVAIADADDSLRLQALRAATGRSPTSNRLLGALAGGTRKSAEREDVLRQRIAALALQRDEYASEFAVDLARERFDRPVIRHALLLGWEGRGLDLLRLILPGAPIRRSQSGVENLCRELAVAIVREGRADAILELLDQSSQLLLHDDRAGRALIEGLLSARPRAPRRLRVARAPVLLEHLAARTGASNPTSKDEDAELARQVLDALAWPGRADLPPEAVVAPLSTEELARFERGRGVYASVCSACHQPSGLGAPGIAPPLRDSDFALGDASRAAAIVLAGLQGPIEVVGRSWDLEMPAWNASDDDLASVLTYVRREWGHTASPVTEADVRSARDRVRQRRGPLDAVALSTWTSAVREGSRSSPLAGWRTIGDALWSVEDGAIRGKVGGGKQSFLATERAYGDFALEVDVKLLGDGNSGIQVRSHQKEDGRVFGYQIEIDPSERAWSGGLYDEGRRGWLNDLSKNDAGRAAFRRGEWNRYRIECAGPWIRAWVNGVPTADWIDPLDLEGFVALQVHSGKGTDVLWRGLAIEDRGTRAWKPICDAERWRESARAVGGVAAPVEWEDGALRLRVRGAAVTVETRMTLECFLVPSRRTLAPGLEVTELGYTVAIGALPLPDTTSWADFHDVIVSTWGNRIAVHVDGRLVVDVRDGSHTRGVSLVAFDPSSGVGEVESIETLGPPVR